MGCLLHSPLIPQLLAGKRRRTIPLVVGEIGYEGIGGIHLEDFQRVAFWLGMLNGAAGYTYGANPVFEAYSADKPFQRYKYTFLTWEEGMDLPGGYEVSLGARLLGRYSWWQFEPHPEWVSPRGTTLLDPRERGAEVDLGNFLEGYFAGSFPQPLSTAYPAGEWKKRNGNYFLPYAAGIPGKVRFVYDPCFGLVCSLSTATAPTILGLESGVRYRAYYWDPTLGVQIDLGNIERPVSGSVFRTSKFDESDKSNWIQVGTQALFSGERMSARGSSVAIANGVNETDLVASVDGRRDSNAGLVLRYHDVDNYLAAVYSPKGKSVYLVERKKGADGAPLSSTPVTALGQRFRLSAEVRGKWAAVSISDGEHTFTSSIVPITNVTAGGAGLRHEDDGSEQSFANFELRKSPTLVTDDHLETKLYDAKGGYRGELKGPGWDDLAKEKIILLDAYRPVRLPMPQDWVLVLDSGK
jgi:hypothetical protein